MPLREGWESYFKILPVIFIGVIDFETPTCLSHHLVLNKDSHEHAIKEIEFHFIELPKFKKTIEHLNTDTDKWIFFLNAAEDLSMVPNELKNPIEVKDALEIFERETWSKEDLIRYKKLIDTERVARGVVKTAEEEGVAKGKIEGEIEGKVEVAKKMLSSGIDIKTICDCTGLKPQLSEVLKRK